jgi:hypothetical protein
MKVKNNGPKLIWYQAINLIRVTEDVEVEIIDVKLFDRLEYAEKFSNVWHLKEGLAAKVEDLEATGSAQVGLSRELAAAQQEIGALEEALQIEKCWYAKSHSRLNTSRWQLVTAEQTVIEQL